MVRNQSTRPLKTDDQDEESKDQGNRIELAVVTLR